MSSLPQNQDTKSFVREIKDGLLHSTEKTDVIKWLRVLKPLLVGPTASDLSSLRELGYDRETISSMHKQISETHIKQLLEVLLTKFTVEWIETIGSENFRNLVKPVYMEGLVKQSFIALFQASAQGERKDFKFQRCVSLLEEFLTQVRLAKLLTDQSMCSPVSENSQGLQDLDPEQQLLLGYLTSLPSKMANKLQRDNSEAFLPQSYIPLLALSIIDTLESAHQVLSRGENISLLFVSVLIGKICSQGYANYLLETLVPRLCVRVRGDYLWCRICERLFSRLPQRCMEATVVPLLKLIPWYGLVEKFLGDSVVNNTSVKMLLCTKLILHRTLQTPKLLLHNILGYLSSFHTRRHLLTEVFLSVLRVWGDSSSMRHISYEQHTYISKALMVCLGYLNNSEKKALESEVLRLLMPGVQAHLESSDPAVRMLGMSVAKSVTETVAPSGPKLEFELDTNSPAVTDLLSYKEIPADPGVSDSEKAVIEAESKLVETKMEAVSIEDDELTRTQTVDSDLDSDDDLVPYDMSHDQKITKAKQPKYIRDCMEGLICSSDEPDRTEICLAAAENLIRKKTDGLEEIAVEFSKVLLHLQDTHSFDNFLSNRFKAMVALAVTCPSQVSEYLTNEFYERNYSIRQRMDILEVVANASQELSSVEKPASAEKLKVASKSGNLVATSSDPVHWREVIQRRIESNTRRFAKGRSRPEPVPTLNRFAAVAGKFFYPLMYGADKSSLCLDLIGRDSLLLFRLLYTLAVVLNSAKNINDSMHMGKALLEFTWPIRLHQDNSVRQAVLVATTTVFLVVPPHFFMADLQSDVTEAKAWLEDVVERDPDTECQKLAAQALFLLHDQIKKEVEGENSSS